MVASLYGLGGIGFSGWDFSIPWVDLMNCLGMGWFQIGLGFVLFPAGARHLQAVELTHLSMTEVIAGPSIGWSAIGEIPSGSSITGGALILAAITLMALVGAKASGPKPPFEAPIS